MDDENEWKALREFSKENHRKRVEKTPGRIEYAIKRFNEEGISWVLKNKSIGHFHLFDKYGNLFQFWASTGKIYFDQKTKLARKFTSFKKDCRGIESCIKIVKYYTK